MATAFDMEGLSRNEDLKGPGREMYEVKVRTAGSPSLSHHSAVAIDNRYMLLVGGWNGRQRCADVHAYDTDDDRWLTLTTTGFPSSGGLSSHTATLVGPSQILVIGREGSLHTQRRHGSAYLLSGQLTSGHMQYTEHSQVVSSRSGHSATFVGSKLYIIGGRCDNFLEVSSIFQPYLSHHCNLMQSISAAASDGCLRRLPKMPCGRKHHVAVPGRKIVLLYGGETFDGRSHDPVGEMIVIQLSSTPQFYSLGTSRLCRSGHACIVTDDAVIMHGGLGKRSDISGAAYYLKFPAQQAS